MDEPWRWQSFHELKGRGLRCLAEGVDHEMWFGVERGAVRYDGLIWKEFHGESGLPSAVGAFAAVGDRMYAATRFANYELGAASGEEATWKPFIPESEGWPWHYRSLAAASNGDLWASTTWDVLRMPTVATNGSTDGRERPTLFTINQIATAVRKHTSLPTIDVETIDSTNWRDVNIGVGLFLYSSTTWGSSFVALPEDGPVPSVEPCAVLYDESDGLSNNRLRNFLSMSDGSLLTSSYAGFDRFENGTWCSSSLPQDLASRANTAELCSNGRGAAWINLSQLSDITHKQAIAGDVAYPSEDSFRTIRCVADNGAPDTYVSQSTTGFREKTGAIISSRGRDRGDATAADSLRYSWAVNGGPWSPFANDTLANMADLAVGQHRFKVRARDTDRNVDASPAVLTFEMTPPIWRKTWFLSLMALAAALIVVAVIQSVRVVRQKAFLKTTNEKLVVAERSLQRSNIDLEGRVRERTAELQNLNNRLLREIDERKSVEERLNESELQYRSIVEDQTEMIIRFQKDGTLTFANNAYQKNNGLMPDTVTDFNCFSIIHPDDRERVIQLVRATSIEEPFAMDVMRIVRPDGAIDWAEWRGRALIDSEGRHYGYQAVGRIMTDLFEAEQKLRESELRYRSIVEDQHEMIIRFDQTGTITFANDAYARDAGCSSEEAIGRSCFDRIHPDDIQEARRLMAASNHTNPFAFMQMRVVLDDGTVRWREWNGRALYNEKNQLFGYQAIGRDITELREAEARLNQKESELAHMARVSALGEMVAGISHEINQPLATISNFSSASQLVLEQKELSDEDRTKLQAWAVRISKQTDRINAIVQRLRRFGRPGSQRQLFSICDAIREALMVTETTTREAVDDLNVDCADNLAFVHADRIQIEQVLVNLIGNACDAMKSVQKGQREIMIRAVEDEQMVTVRVSDTGPGIPADHEKEVFDMFVTSKPEGMGMGLAISRSIIEAHGGKICCVTGDSGGQFEFSLPIGEHSGNE